MAWVRLDDGYPEHPKVDRVGPLAAWLNVCAWAYCARNLTDGFVPEGRVDRLAKVTNAKKLAASLVDAKLWERVDGGYLVHDFLAYNPSRETVLKERAATSKRVSEWRDKHGSNGVTTHVTNGVRTGVTNGVSTPPPVPIPSHPDIEPETTPKGVMSVSVETSPGDDRVDEVYEHFKARIQPGSRLNPRKKIAARLKRFSSDDLKAGIDHFADDWWWMEHNSDQGAAWFFESDAQSERFLLLKPRLKTNVVPMNGAPRKPVDAPPEVPADSPFLKYRGVTG